MNVTGYECEKYCDKYCEKVYLTDDNPRNEIPKKIRSQIKSKISRKKLIEIPSRKNAILKAINNYSTAISTYFTAICSYKQLYNNSPTMQ